MRRTSTSVTPLSPLFGATLEELEARKRPARALRRRVVLALLAAFLADGLWRGLFPCVVWCRWCGRFVLCPDVVLDLSRWPLP